jgi:N-acylglucosamine-6-phosphate 2-epimerase
VIDLDILKHKLIVSCQPVTRGPMDRIDIIVAMAKSAVAGGAAGLRVEGVENLRAVASEVKVPIIGLIKRDLPDSPVRITPFLQDVEALARSGAQIIAFDVTTRPRPAAVEALYDAVHKAGCVAMADCSCMGDALACRGNRL